MEKKGCGDHNVNLTVGQHLSLSCCLLREPPAHRRSQSTKLMQTLSHSAQAATTLDVSNLLQVLEHKTNK
eukprot:1870806-Amphidinium_carterae.1